MANSQITVRVPDGVKVLWKEMADREGRSMTNYLERLLLRERVRCENVEVTLESLDNKLDVIVEFFSESKKRTSSKYKENKLTASDAWRDCDVCEQENWDKWVDHMRKLGKPLNYYRANKQFDMLCELRDEEWDCDKLIDCLINKGHGTFYIPPEWRRK